MAIGCEQCEKTFRTQSGKAWHLQHIHADLPIQECSGQVKTSELEAIVENEITAHMEPDSLTPYLGDLKPAKVEDESEPLTPYLRDDEPAKVKNGSDQLAPYLREWKPSKVEDEPRGLATWLRDTKAPRPVKVVEMACEYSTTSKSCSMPRGHQRPIDPRYSTRPMKIATDEMIRDALEYCSIAV